MGSPEEIKNQVILDRDFNRNFASGPMASSHNIACEPVPIDTKPPAVVSASGGGGGQTQSKWKNAFGFVYQVRKRLNNQPQIYNDFIDIMRKVHNQTIDTVDVVTVISDLFKDHPDLIRGFNAFLPDKHKIDVKVPRLAVSGIPSPDSPSGDPNEREELPITTRIIRFTLNVRKRFEDDEKNPEKYKRFVEVLYLYKALSQQLQGLRKCKKTLKEEEVYAEVRKLFENNEDLLQEFSEYLPYNKNLSDIYKDSCKSANEDMPYNCSCCSDVSSSEQSDSNNGAAQKSAGFGRANDEVTSSVVDTGLDHLSEGLCLPSRDIKHTKKFDIGSTHLTIKSEILDINDYEKNYRGDSLIDREIDSLIIPKKERINCFIDGNGENCENEFSSELQVANSDFEGKKLTFRDAETVNDKVGGLEISQELFKNENFIKCEEPSNFFPDKYSLDDNGEFAGDESVKGRTPRKPLTPFKIPLPPNRITDETKTSFKRFVNDEYSPTVAVKNLSALRAASRSPSPPDPEMETSFITRLAKRAALASPSDEDESLNGMSSPHRRPAGATLEASPAAKSSSDKRLRNLRKRLRRLANL